MLNWRIFYDDGTTFDSTQGEPHEAPAWGFVCAVGYDDADKRYVMCGWDHYCFDRGADQWWGCDMVGWLDRSLRGVMYAHKAGRTVTNAQYKAIIKAAQDDADFPQWGRNE